MMRCFALAQAFQSTGGRVVFLSYCENEAVRQRIIGAGMEFVPIPAPNPSPQDLETTLAFLRAYSSKEVKSPAWVVLDNYHFDEEYQKSIRAAGFPLLVIDDMAHLAAYHAELLLNQNPGSEKLNYCHTLDTNLLLGPRFTLLRQEFLTWRDWQRRIPNVALKVLVTMGGSDEDNVTLKVLQALEQVHLSGLEAVVIVGGSNPHYETLQSVIPNLQLNARLERDAKNMPELLAWADVAVSAGGSTCYELAFMGLPSLVIILAENQRIVASELEASGISVNLGWHADISPGEIALKIAELAGSSQLRAEMSERGKKLVDGYGAARVVECLYRRTLVLREARETDSRLIYDWANDPTTRAVSFSTEAIPWETHQKWYAAKLADPRGIILVALDLAGTPVGMVRYQLEGMESVVSINLAPDQRGKGYGVQMLQASAEMLFKAGKTDLIHAYIKPDNTPSLRVFSKAGFIEKDRTDFHGNPACHFILSKEML